MAAVEFSIKIKYLLFLINQCMLGFCMMCFLKSELYVFSLEVIYLLKYSYLPFYVTCFSWISTCLY